LKKEKCPSELQVKSDAIKWVNDASYYKQCPLSHKSPRRNCVKETAKKVSAEWLEGSFLYSPTPKQMGTDRIGWAIGASIPHCNCHYIFAVTQLKTP